MRLRSRVGQTWLVFVATLAAFCLIISCGGGGGENLLTDASTDGSVGEVDARSTSSDSNIEDASMVEDAPSNVISGGEAAAGCASGDQCPSGVCDVNTGQCQPPSCDDTVMNGDETDIDCGGPSCPACVPGQECGADGDCTSGVCDTDVCAEPACDDDVLNGDETNIDCGGTDCGATCENGEACLRGGDCISGVCDDTAFECESPTCSDDVLNQDETDVDCGGSDCSPCREGKDCLVNSDCVSDVCDDDSLSCLGDSCSDEVRNGDETDVDCGGPDCPTCTPGQMCDDNTDCDSSVCDTDDHTCDSPTCSDEVRNQDETDVDCGGTECDGCDDGMRCLANRDCLSGPCESSTDTCISFNSCTTILNAGYSTGDGVYTIDIDSSGAEPPFDVYCDMTSDGGGWTLLGVVSGSDTNQWNTLYGYWSDNNLLGDLSQLDADYKSQAWIGLDLSTSEIMLERRYDDSVEAQSVLINNCLMGNTLFTELFATPNTDRACLPTDIITLRGSATGVASVDYAEGLPSRYGDSSGNYALGGPGTNGFCWNGGDTSGNVFDGHIMWNQYPGVTDCMQVGHLGGIGVYQNSNAQYTNADITGTNWLNGTSYSLTSIRFYARDRVIITGSLTDADPGMWSDGTVAASCLEYRHPSGDYAYQGTRGDGVYAIDPDGSGPGTAYNVYCDMTTNGGGWILLGVVAGADADNWDTQYGYWSDSNLLGSLDDINSDFKSEAWINLDLSSSEIMLERQYDGSIEAQSVLANTCLMGNTFFTEMFDSTDTSLACLPTDILTLRGSTTGVNSAGYAEGSGASALGGSGTNGFCWNGGDTVSNVFDGHIMWNQYPGVTDCMQAGHLGGIGVYQNSHDQYTNADITGTNWLNGTSYGLTVIRFYAREFSVGISGSFTDADPGVWSDGMMPTSCRGYYNQPPPYSAWVPDGIYTIDVDGSGDLPPFNVFCDMTGGGWTLVLQNNRTVAPSPFPNYADSVDAITITGTFGPDLSTFDILVGLSYWNMIGTELLAETGNYARIAAPTTAPPSHQAIYPFTLNPSNDYAIGMGAGVVTAGATEPGLKTYHSANSYGWTTADHDVDVYASNCATLYNYSWWYGACWSGSFWGSQTGSYQNAAFWTGSGSDYWDYGGIWLR